MAKRVQGKGLGLGMAEEQYPIEELLNQNVGFEEGSFLRRLKEGYFDVGLFNQVIGELRRLQMGSAHISQSVVARFGLFTCYTLMHIKWHFDSRDAYACDNLDRLDDVAIMGSLEWCSIALAYDKSIGDTVFIADERPNAE
ncbi:MAG: hypothetical protein IPJ76_09720 [Flavobacteriales bacterium]|nr:MAG: hypothetical protein IPJ76_09720 [Flavobacteriales bacterium]